MKLAKKKEPAHEKSESESFSRPLTQNELTRENSNFKFKRHLPAGQVFPDSIRNKFFDDILRFTRLGAGITYSASRKSQLMNL
jgi:hypothetical protein